MDGAFDGCVDVAPSQLLVLEFSFSQQDDPLKVRPMIHEPSKSRFVRRRTSFVKKRRIIIIMCWNLDETEAKEPHRREKEARTRRTSKQGREGGRKNEVNPKGIVVESLYKLLLTTLGVAKRRRA